MKTDVAMIGGGVVGVAVRARAGAPRRAGRGARARTRRPRLLVRQRRLADAVAGGAAGQPEHAVQVVQLDARSGEPALHPAAARPVAICAGSPGFSSSSRRAKFERGAAALVELCRASVDLWEEFAKRSSEPFGFERHGLLAVYENAASLDGRARRDRSGCEARRPRRAMDADEVREREPAIVGRAGRRLFLSRRRALRAVQGGARTRRRGGARRRAVPGGRRGLRRLTAGRRTAHD